MEKTMGKEKTDMLSKWILDEKSRQIKEETTNKDYEPVDEVQNEESRGGSSINGEYEEPYTKGENLLKIDTNQENVSSDIEKDLVSIKGDENTLKPDENVQEHSEASGSRTTNLKKKWLDEYRKEEMSEVDDNATPNKVAKDADNAEVKPLEEEKIEHKFVSEIEKAFLECMEMEYPPDTKKEEQGLMDEFTTFSGEPVDNPVINLCPESELEIEVNGKMRKANEIISLMDQASQLNQKALFECSTDEMKEKVEQNWEFNKEEYNEDIGNLDFNRITISEEKAMNLDDLKKSWTNFYTEIEKIGSEGENVLYVGSDENEDGTRDEETDNINIMLNSVTNFNECNKLFNDELNQIKLDSDDLQIVIDGIKEEESGHNDSPLAENEDTDCAETCDVKCCNVYESCCFMSISEQMKRFIKNENNLPILD